MAEDKNDSELSKEEELKKQAEEAAKAAADKAAAEAKRKSDIRKEAEKAQDEDLDDDEDGAGDDTASRMSQVAAAAAKRAKASASKKYFELSESVAELKKELAEYKRKDEIHTVASATGVDEDLLEKTKLAGDELKAFAEELAAKLSSSAGMLNEFVKTAVDKKASGRSDDDVFGFEALSKAVHAAKNGR